MDKIVASLASIPEREFALEMVVKSLYNHVDRLNVFLNGYSYVPTFLRRRKIDVARSQNHNDLGDAGKFFWAGLFEGYCFHCDDDLFYPEDYVPCLVRAIERYNRKAIVGLHGCEILSPFECYGKSRRLWHYQKRVRIDKHVHLLGTGTVAYHTSTAKLCVADFPLPNMADAWLALEMQRQNVPMVCVAHPENWLRAIKGTLQNSIYRLNQHTEEGQRRAEYQNRVLSIEWKKPRLPAPEVSIIITAHKDRGYLDSAIQSALNQTSTRTEIILAIDGNPDIEKYAEKYRIPFTNTDHIPNGKIRGWGQNFNTALAKCRGQYVKLLHDDDVLEPDCLQDLVAALEDQDADFVHSNAYWKRGNEKHPEKPSVLLPDVNEICDSNPINGGTTLYRRQALLNVNGVNETLWTGEEWELHLRLLHNGYRLGYANVFSFSYRQHAMQKSPYNNHFFGDEVQKIRDEIRKIYSVPTEIRGCDCGRKSGNFK